MQIIAGIEHATETHNPYDPADGPTVKNMVNPMRSYNNFYMGRILIKKSMVKQWAEECIKSEWYVVMTYIVLHCCNFGRKQHNSIT